MTWLVCIVLVDVTLRPLIDSICSLMDSDLLINMEVGYLASSVHQFSNTGSDMSNQIPQEWLSFEIDTAGARRLGHCYEY